MQAFFLSHNGLGDNLFSIGAVRFLTTFYEKIYLLCKEIHVENVKLFFIDEPKIKIIIFDSSNEYKHCNYIIKKNYANNDIFICGCHKNYLTSKITNKFLLNRIKNDQGYDLNYDTITDLTYSPIKGIYEDINLDLSIFYDYFYLPQTDKSKELYDSVKNYRIILIQTSCSTNKKLNIDNLKKKYLNDDNAIMISTSENLYNKTVNKIKHSICEQFVFNKLIYYLDTIINCSEIYIIDSCFTGIVLPLKKTNKLKADVVRIIHRDLADNVYL
jgi:hypothetical protein